MLKNLTEAETPIALLKFWNSAMPGWDKSMDMLRQDCPPDMHPACPIPIAAATSVISVGAKMDPVEASGLAGELTALYAWRKNKVIYRIDPTLMEALSNQALEMNELDTVPIDLFYKLPFPCIYIQSQFFRDECEFDGFFTWIEWDTQRKETELRFQIVSLDKKNSLPVTMHLTGETIIDCLKSTVEESAKYSKAPVDEETKENAAKKGMKVIPLFLQAVLYLVSADNDVIEDSAQKQVNRREKQRDKKNWKKKVSVSSVALYNVGVRVGSALNRPIPETPGNHSGGTREATGRTVTPHLRRAHWHHFWTGPRNKPDERELILRWVPPTAVGANNDPDFDAGVVIHPVK